MKNEGKICAQPHHLIWFRRGLFSLASFWPVFAGQALVPHCFFSLVPLTPLPSFAAWFSIQGKGGEGEKEMSIRGLACLTVCLPRPPWSLIINQIGLERVISSLLVSGIVLLWCLPAVHLFSFLLPSLFFLFPPSPNLFLLLGSSICPPPSASTVIIR